MAAETKTKKPWLRRTLWGVVALMLICAIALFALRIFIATSGGARFIESQVNKRSFGPIERVEISGLSGDPLSEFSLASVTLYDVDGVWMRAKDLSMTWNVWSLRDKVLDLDSLTVKTAELIRRPQLNPPSTSASPDTPYTVQLGTGRVDALTLNESLIGQAAILSLSGELTTQANGNIRTKLEALRLDSAGDELVLDFSRSPLGKMRGDFVLSGAAGGTYATFLRAPEGAAISVAGELRGNTETGEGQIEIKFNGAPKVAATGDWMGGSANLKANINTANWALFDSARRGLGERVTLTANLNRQSTLTDFNVSLESSRLAATARGKMNATQKRPSSAEIRVNTNDIGALLPMPEGFELGAGTIDGTLTLSPQYAFDGEIDVSEIETPHGKAASLTGPIKLMQTGVAEYAVKTNLDLNKLRTETQLPLVLSETTQLKAGMGLNTKTAQLKDIAVNIRSGENRLALSGSAHYRVPSYKVSGDVAASISAAGAWPSGDLQSTFSLQKTASSALAISGDGAFTPSSALAPPFDQLIPEGVTFGVNMSPVTNGVRISEAYVRGENIRAALAGSITETFDVDGEALLQAPLTYQSASVSGESSASFTVTGSRAAPNIRLDSKAERVEIVGYALDGARLRAELEDIFDAPKGPLRITADTAQGALDFSTNFASREQVFITDDIALNWGRLTASGTLSKPVSAPITGELQLNLPEDGNQFARAGLILSAQGQTQGISLEAEAKNIAYNNFALDSLSAKIEGTLSSLSGNIAAKGRQQQDILERAFEIKSPLSLTRSDEGAFKATLNPDLTYGNIVIEAGPPIAAEYTAGDITLIAPLQISGARVDLRYSKTSGQESLNLKAEKLPTTLLPLPGLFADTRGQLDVAIELATSAEGSGITGGGTLTLLDWRGFDVDKDMGLTTKLDLSLAQDRLNWKLDARSPVEFTAQGDGALPLSNTASLTALRPKMDAPITGQFTASGAAAALLSLVTPSDAKPSGQLQANLKLSGTLADPLIEGRATGSALSLEVPQLGTRLKKGRFTAEFTNDSLTVRDVSLSDTDKGTISGQGQFKLGEYARPIGELSLKANDFRALDRSDYEGKVTGNLSVKSSQDTTLLEGDITLNRVEVKQFANSTTTVIEIPVEEINKPERLELIEIKAPARPVDLNVRLRAPRRIFVRSRGLDVELSLDATITGTLTEPEVFGEAIVLRGGYKIAGEEIEIESGSIKFNGAIGEARVNLVANTTTQNLSASVTVKGTVAAPEIDLSSTPERPQDEILSAILFGRSATELSAIEAAQLAGALAQFSGAGGGFDLMGGLRDALGVGQLSIGLGEEGGAQITGGRYLAKNVYLQVFSGGGTGQTGALIEWELRRNISLLSKIQSDNDQSLTLKVKRDF
jgi:translocation and assembly module TamB